MLKSQIAVVVLIVVLEIMGCAGSGGNPVSLGPDVPVISNAMAGDGSATIVWDPVSGAISYNLYYAAGPTVDKLNGAELTYVTSPQIVTGLTNGIQYTFAVSAVSARDESLLSHGVTLTPNRSNGFF
ncbi:MAG: fibronectin type III domain-containing protein [Chitinivibrionales bacterium]|nr:fibronectin type III domain-containing protein [Chitinivibrionales bacterium]